MPGISAQSFNQLRALPSEHHTRQCCLEASIHQGCSSNKHIYICTHSPTDCQPITSSAFQDMGSAGSTGVPWEVCSCAGTMTMASHGRCVGGTGKQWHPMGGVLLRRSHDHGIPWQVRERHWEAVASHERRIAAQVP